MTSQAHYVKLTNSTTGLIDVRYRGYANNVNQNAFMFTKRNEKVTLTYETSSISNFRFYYAKGQSSIIKY